MSSRAAFFALLAAVAGSSGWWLGWQHPVAPWSWLVLFCAVAIATARAPRVLLLLIPACLPWLSFSPWTGWILFDEFDGLVLAVLCGGYARLAFLNARSPVTPRKEGVSVGATLVTLMLASGAVALWRGMAGDGALVLDLYHAYDDPLNSVRVSKSLVWAGALFPLIRWTILQDGMRARQMLARGMGLGLFSVAAAALWERLAYPGLTDFSAVYRVTALFWEIHVGGGAIDAYLAMASPFAVLLLLQARGWHMRVLAIVLLAGVAHACLTTFSRGVYLAVVVPLALAGLATLVNRLQRGGAVAAGAGEIPVGGRISRGYWALVLVPGVVVWLVTGPDSFLSNRLMGTESVWAQRLQHWKNSIRLLETPADWLLGVGAGRYPALHSQRVAGGSFAGAVVPIERDGATRLILRGPERGGDGKGGLYALTQRIELVPGARYQVRIHLRPLGPAVLLVQVCERHLLYDRACQGIYMKVAPTTASSQQQAVPLFGDPFAPGPWFAPRLGMFSVSVVNGGGAVELHQVQLEIADGREMLANGDLSDGMARWFPAAQYYFEPWHPDSLYLDWLIERGVLALLCGLALVGYAARQGVQCLRSEPRLALCLLASMLGALLVGAVSSFLDVPRVAVLFYLLSCFSIEMARSTATITSRTSRT